jgi:hypothetical protein
MSDALSPKSQAFLRSVQDADDPTRDDYDRVRAGVKARLAASVAAGVAALVTAKTVAASEAAVLTAAAATATTATAVTAVTTASVGGGAAVPTGSAGVAFATKLVAVVLVVGAAAGGTRAVVRHQQAMHASAAEATMVHATADVPRDLQAPQARPPMPLPPTLATALATVEPTSPPAPPALTPPPASAPSPAPSPALATALTTTETAFAPSSLDAEIALVRDARAALRGGDAARALALLDEHTRRFSRGALAEDCDAERIYALCALGRSGEARSLATRFLTSHPASPHGASVRASCGGGTN